MNIQLQEKYILPSPAGAYYCISNNTHEPIKHFLQQLMLKNKRYHLDSSTLDQLLGNDIAQQKKILFHIEKLKWLQVFNNAGELPSISIEKELPELLGLLSSEGKVLLADNNGFCLARTGFTHEASEELSALSADLSSLYTRHQGIIKGNLNINSSAFALVDAAGYSQLGFWPLYVGEQLFVLVLSGVPRFEQNTFVNIIWSLYQRYYITT